MASAIQSTGRRCRSSCGLAKKCAASESCAIWVRIQYTRNDLDLRRGTFRARGDTLEIVPGYSETAFRIYLWGDEIEKIVEFHPLTGEVARIHQQVTIFPAREYITDDEHIRDALHEIEQELDEQIARFKREDKLIEGAAHRAENPI